MAGFRYHDAVDCCVYVPVEWNNKLTIHTYNKNVLVLKLGDQYYINTKVSFNFDVKYMGINGFTMV